MKYIKKFNETDELSSSNIVNLCRNFRISKYTIDNNGVVDVNEYIDIKYKELSKINIQFGIINGSFFCGLNKLTSLKGCPKEVSGNFSCENNNLSTLEYCPEKVGGIFDCSHNKITTLKNSPVEIGSAVNCSENNFKSLEGLPKMLNSFILCSFNKELVSLYGIEDCEELLCPVTPIFEVYKLFNSDYKAYKDSLDYNYWSGIDIIKLRFKEALEEIGKELPEFIQGYKYI